MHTTALATEVAPAYQTRLASSPDDIRAAQRLRFEVFNRELNEGLKESWQTYLDADRFDDVCDHLLVEQTSTGRIVGTYRLQTGVMAAANLGYYSAQEFDFAGFEPFRAEIVELGRACVHHEFRKLNILNLLWRGIANYARERGARYLVGCSSLTSQDPAEGVAMYRKLGDHLAPEPFRTVPIGAFVMPGTGAAEECAEPPRLLRAYLAIGAKICGPPALDREFGTIDFLTLVDLNHLPMAVHQRFMF